MTTSSDVPDTATLIARAASLRPLLERNAERTDAERRLPSEVVQALRETGLCALMVPKRFGGYQTSVRAYVDVMSELGCGCGSTAWVASLINVCAWLASLFPEQAQKDIWESNPDAWAAGSLAPNGEATAWSSAPGAVIAAARSPSAGPNAASGSDVSGSAGVVPR